MIPLYFMILLANDGLLTKSEILGFAMCLEVAAVIALIDLRRFPPHAAQSEKTAGYLLLRTVNDPIRSVHSSPTYSFIHN